MELPCCTLRAQVIFVTKCGQMSDVLVRGTWYARSQITGKRLCDIQYNAHP